MAQAERRAEEKKSNKREAAKERREGSRRAGGKFQMSLMGWAVLTALTSVLMEHDGALRIGFTRDGGALALGVYMENDYATEYIRPAEDFYTAVSEIADAWVADGAQRLGELLVSMGWSEIIR